MNKNQSINYNESLDPSSYKIGRLEIKKFNRLVTGG